MLLGESFFSLKIEHICSITYKQKIINREGNLIIRGRYKTRKYLIAWELGYYYLFLKSIIAKTTPIFLKAFCGEKTEEIKTILELET